MHLSDRFPRWLTWLAGPRGVIAAVSAVVMLALLGAGLLGSRPASGAGRAPAAALAAATASRPAGHRTGQTATGPARQRLPQHLATVGAAVRARAAAPGSPAASTSCRAVAHIGDSTSVGLISPDYLPSPAQRLQARYAAVGVGKTWVDASGGRSIVESLPGQVNGYGVATSWDRQGFRGCWVLALGTNDTANASVGSSVGLTERIRRMMSAAHGQPVMWVNVKTLDSAGPWAESNMALWNSALTQACARYPNMRVFDWASAARDGWFISDGIHYTSAGYAARAKLIAGALARAFPSGAHSHGCVVR
jgi:GDSL-like Lipase/Acylhydrolase family